MIVSNTLDEFESITMAQMNDLYRSARRTLGSHTEAEDVVQETYLQAWKSFHRFQRGTNIRAWMFKILFHMIHQHRRKFFRLVTLKEEESTLFDQLTYEPPVAPQLQDEDMLAALDRMPEHFRTVILLADVQEFSYREIQEVLGIPIGTVMSRLSRGRKLLRASLADFAPTSSVTVSLTRATSFGGRAE